MLLFGELAESCCWLQTFFLFSQIKLQFLWSRTALSFQSLWYLWWIAQGRLYCFRSIDSLRSTRYSEAKRQWIYLVWIFHIKDRSIFLQKAAFILVDWVRRQALHFLMNPFLLLQLQITIDSMYYKIKNSGGYWLLVLSRRAEWCRWISLDHSASHRMIVHCCYMIYQNHQQMILLSYRILIERSRSKS